MDSVLDYVNTVICFMNILIHFTGILMLLTVKEMEVHHVFMSSLGLAEIKILVLELCWYFGLQIGSGVPQIGRVQIFNPRVHMIILTINAFLAINSPRHFLLFCLAFHAKVSLDTLTTSRTHRWI